MPKEIKRKDIDRIYATPTAEKIANIVNELEKDTVVKVKYFDDGYDKEYTGTIKVDIFERKIKLIAEKKTINLDDLLDMNKICN